LNLPGPQRISREYADIRPRSGPFAPLRGRFAPLARFAPTLRALWTQFVAHLLTRRPEIERVDAAAAFLEDTANLPEFEGIAHVVAGHWPLIAPRLNTWLERGGPYRALAMKVIAFGTNTSIRLADADAFEGLITTARAVRWGNATPVVARWICGCASVPNAPSDERCGNCGLLTRGLHTRDVPFHPSLLLPQLVQQHKLLRFIQPVPTSGEPLDPHRERGHPT